MKNTISNNVDYKLHGQVRLTVSDGDTIIKDTGYINNLILNQGMDEVARRPIAELFTCCAIGTGLAEIKKTNVPVTGSIISGNGFDQNLLYSTAKRSGPLLTFPRISPSYPISGSVIRASDLGNYITVVGDSTFRIKAQTGSNQARSCSVLNLDGTVPTGSVSDKNYTIYFTNQTSMSAETQRCGRNNDGNNFPAASGSFGAACSTTFGSGFVTHNRQFNFAAATVDQTSYLTEVGLSWLPFFNSPALFSRIRLTSGSAGTALAKGQAPGSVAGGVNVIVSDCVLTLTFILSEIEITTVSGLISSTTGAGSTTTVSATGAGTASGACTTGSSTLGLPTKNSLIDLNIFNYLLSLQ